MHTTEALQRLWRFSVVYAATRVLCLVFYSGSVSSGPLGENAEDENDAEPPVCMYDWDDGAIFAFSINMRPPTCDP